jgi:hypothetical protein
VRHSDLSGGDGVLVDTECRQGSSRARDRRPHGDHEECCSPGGRDERCEHLPSRPDQTSEKRLDGIDIRAGMAFALGRSPTCTEIRQDPNLRHLPVVAVFTTATDPEFVKRA